MELWEEFSTYKKCKLKASSYRKLRDNFENHILPYFKDYNVEDINSRVYVTWMNEIDKKDLAFSSKENIRSSISSMLDYAMEYYDLESNIVKRIGRFNKGKKKTKPADFWTLEEFETFISFVDEDLYKLLFKLLFFTGARLGELLALNWKDYKGTYLNINKTLIKEKLNGECIINAPKTPQSIRQIYLDDNSIKLLEEHRIKEKDKVGYKKDWYIFGGPKPLSHTTITRKKDNYCNISGIKKIKLHEFRHSHATLLYSKNIPVTAIADRIGHSDINVTANIYIHLTNEDKLKAVNVLNALNQNT